ncbi:MAG: chemotaxis protein CheW [Sporolactobacillus sp.]
MQLLTFTVGKEPMVILIDDVQEIVEPIPVARMPVTDHALKGLLTLRGRVVPLIDLHHLFSLTESQTEGADSLFLIVRSRANLAAVQIDDVGEIIHIDEKTEIEKPKNEVEATCLEGKLNIDGRLHAWLNVDGLARIVQARNTALREVAGIL